MCDHKGMTDKRMGDEMVSTCPDCGFHSSVPMEQVEETTTEVLEEIIRQEEKSKP